MGRIVTMTAKEIFETIDVEKALEMAKNAPEFDEDPNPGGRPIARGFAEFQEYINRQDRLKAQEPKVSISIKIPKSKATRLKETGPGWQTRISNFIVSGIDRGELVPLG